VRDRRGSKGAEGGDAVLRDVLGEIDVLSCLDYFDVEFTLSKFNEIIRRCAW